MFICSSLQVPCRATSKVQSVCSSFFGSLLGNVLFSFSALWCRRQDRFGVVYLPLFFICPCMSFRLLCVRPVGYVGGKRLCMLVVILVLIGKVPAYCFGKPVCSFRFTQMLVDRLLLQQK